MQTYILRRFLLIIPTFLLVTIIIFLTIRLIPGNVIEKMISQMALMGAGNFSNEEAIAEIERFLGLDLPMHIQYAQWIGGVLQGDLGLSLWTKAPVTRIISDRVPASFELGFLALIISLAIALPVGILSAIRPNTAGDYILRSIAIFFICVPSFWLGTLILTYPSIWWGWGPRLFYVSFFEDPIGNLGMFLIPAFVLGMWLSGITMRLTRSMMLEVLRQDYVRTAWSKGLRERVIMLRHVLKNAMIPVVTMIGLQLPVLIGGAVVIEYLFSLPGLGALVVSSLVDRDYTIVSGVNLIITGFVLVVNVLVDLSYAWLDPRIRYK